MQHIAHFYCEKMSNSTNETDSARKEPITNIIN